MNDLGWHGAETWQWLRSTPLLGVFLTFAGYALGREVQRRTGGHSLAQPVFVATLAIGAVLWLGDITIREYAVGGDVIGFFLAPATVALAVPLHRQMHHLKEMLLPMLIALPAGAAVSVGSGYFLVRWLGGPDAVAVTMAPKSATTPVAMALSEQVGGISELAAVLTLIAGILGAIFGPALLTLLRVPDRRVRGLALGSVSHGIGTSRALQDDPLEGAFAGLAMGLTALVTSLVLPLVLLVLG